MQIGFMNLVVMPLYDELFNLVRIQCPAALEPFSSVCETLVNNHQYWMSQQKTTEDDTRSDVYIPQPNDYSGSNKNFDMFYERDSSGSQPDLMQQVYTSGVLRRSHSNSTGHRLHSIDSPQSVGPISLTYSQAHGLDDEEEKV